MPWSDEVNKSTQVIISVILVCRVDVDKIGISQKWSTMASSGQRWSTVVGRGR